MTNIKTGIATTLSILVLVAMMFVLNGEAMAATNNLYWGCKGPEVVQAQTVLNQKGYWAGNADGIFGPKTYQAVVKFQRDNNSILYCFGPFCYNLRFGAKQLN